MRRKPNTLFVAVSSVVALASCALKRKPATVLVVSVVAVATLVLEQLPTFYPWSPLDTLRGAMYSTANQTRIYQLSDGIDVYENVCILEHTAEGEGGAIVSYTADRKPMTNDYKVDYGQAGWADWSVKTAGRSIVQWEKDSKGVLIEEETLVLMDLWKNPAHCLTDLAFSLAMDVANRTNENTTTPFYPKFVHFGFWFINDVCPIGVKPGDVEWWCCAFMHRAGLINAEEGIVPRPAQSQLNDPMCFRKLLVPRLAAFRYPIHENVMDSVRLLQNKVLKGTHLMTSSWPPDETFPEEVPVLMYDRKGSGRRMMNNSDIVKKELEEKYRVKVHLLGERWEDLKFTEQTALFNHFPRIIAPHGAHLANLFFSRPGTKMMEVGCAVHELSGPFRPNLNLTSVNDAKYSVEWYGEARHFGHAWFNAFSRRLGVEHFVFEEFHGCFENGTLRDDYSPEVFEVNVTTFVPYVASRFGLKKREPKEGQ